MNILTKLRSGTLKLNLEVGRLEKMSKELIFCCYNINCVESEYHFVLVCPVYLFVKCRFLPNYHCSWSTKRCVLF